MSERRALILTLLVWAILEFTVYGVLVSRGSSEFHRFVSASDTGTYARPATAMAFHGTMVPSNRTLGYPIVLASFLWIGGAQYGYHLMIAAQLLMALGLGFGTWRLTGRTCPDSSLTRKVVLASAVWFGCLGVSFYVLTDLLTSTAFFIFLYGLLYWRSAAGQVIVGLAAGMFTLTRPTFTFFPLLLPWIGYLVYRMNGRAPKRALALAGAFSVAATLASTAYQLRFNHYFGPSPIAAFNVRQTLNRLDSPETIDRRFEIGAFELAGKPFDALSPSDQERVAREIISEDLRRRPITIIATVAATFLKYLLGPVESLVSRFAQDSSLGAHYGAIRALLTLLGAPVFLLAYVPPPSRKPRVRMYYFIIMSCVVYVLGLSSFAPSQGERMRLPLLPFVVTLAAVNWDEWRRAFATRRRRLVNVLP